MERPILKETKESFCPTDHEKLNPAKNHMSELETEPFQWSPKMAADL